MLRPPTDRATPGEAAPLCRLHCSPARPLETTLTAFAVPRLPLSEADEGFSAPGIEEFFPPPVLFEGTPFQLNRIMLLRLLVMVVLVVVFMLYVRRANLLPTGFTSTIELGLDFVRTQVAEQILGERDGRRFLPLLVTIFFMVFALNITGIVPGLNIAGTSVVGTPLVLALVVWLVFIAVGIQTSGVFGYFRSTLFPAGVPGFLYPLVAPIELLAVFVLRPFTLTVRLLANMIVGHILLVLCFKATDALFGALLSGEVVGVLFVLTLLGGFAFTLFEILVALLQAFIFSLLSALYINGSLHPEH